VSFIRITVLLKTQFQRVPLHLKVTNGPGSTNSNYSYTYIFTQVKRDKFVKQDSIARNHKKHILYTVVNVQHSFA